MRAVNTCCAVSLPSDGPFELLIHPNGTWELIILDLWQANIGNGDREMLQEQNWAVRSRFLQDLHKVRQLL